MSAPDPVDARLLALLADYGRVSVQELAARLRMDPREAAARLVALSRAGLPLAVGAECDPHGIRAALARAGAWPGGPAGGGSIPAPGEVAGTDAMAVWGPPQTASWTRADQPVSPTLRNDPRTGAVGQPLQTRGPHGQRLTVQLVELVDPADFLVTAAGYRLRPGERAVVAHTQMTNHGTLPYADPPDRHLVLVTAEGTTIGKTPMSLSSRPSHSGAVANGETVGGHSVYLMPVAVRVAAVRWSAGATPDGNEVTWTISLP